MTGEEIAREIINMLSTVYGVSSLQVLGVMRDRASINNVATRTLRIVYPNIVDIGCFSHTFNLIGEKFVTPVLLEFMTSWISLYAHSPKACFLWKEQTGHSITMFCPTRWWSRWEVMNQLLVQFGDVEMLLKCHEDLAPATQRKLLGIISDPQKYTDLKIELAATIDVGEPFVKATYSLEGDGPLVLQCYEVVSSVNTSIESAHYPNLNAVPLAIAPNDPITKQKLVEHGLHCVQPGLTYFNECLSGPLKTALDAFKAARLFSPQKINEMKPDFSVVDSLSVFPFLNDPSVIANLKLELRLYVTKTADINSDFCPLEWWKLHSSEIPEWSSAAAKVLLLQPSSACCGMCFLYIEQYLQ